uniref:NADH dehydrogenase subunit 4 n=1 Tax=Lima vulgaris TaxID=2671060 RepID=UPI0028FCB782|nr:NADH dehydrogenase subunit 4 [Lima vulgaris]WNB40317.1 NADH dehydrogenase subunit 4 [Lima vulgaris]
MVGVLCLLAGVVVLGNSRAARYVAGWGCLVSVLLLVFKVGFSSGVAWRVGELYSIFDGLSGPLILLSVWLGGLSILAMEEGGGQWGKDALVVSVLLSVLALSSGDLLVFFFFFEASLLPVGWLIVRGGLQPERFQSVQYMILYTVASSLPLLAWLMVFFCQCGHLFIPLKTVSLEVGGSMVMFLLWAFLVKVPSFPWHIWLPKAHVEAPVGGSMMLAGIMLKLGGVGLIRILTFSEVGVGIVLDMFCAWALWGAVLAGLICLRELDMKSLVAYSSVSHMGLVVLGILGLSSVGWGGASVMMIAHGLASSGLFFLVNSIYVKVGSRSLVVCAGLLGVAPGIVAWWFIGVLLSSGCPPSLSLVGEVMILGSVVGVSVWQSVMAGVIMFLSVAYGLYLYGAVSHGGVSLRLAPMSAMSSYQKLISVLHFVPLGLLIASSEVVAYCV